MPDLILHGGRGPGAGKQGRLLLTVLLCLAVAAAALAPRYLHSNRTHLLTWDKAEYAGAARDYLQYGAFEERTHSQALFHFLPLGYPALVVAWAKTFGGTVHDAALRVNVVLGSLLCVLLFLFARQATGSLAAAAFAGFLGAAHFRLVGASATVMTDMAYMAGFLLLAWLTFALFASEQPRYVWGFVSAAVVFAAMYLVRVSTLYLYPGIPGLYLVLALAKRRGVGRGFFLGAVLFLVMGAGVVGAVSWRLSQLNGYFTLTPQIAANQSMGDFRDQGRGDTFDLDPETLQVNWAARNSDSPGLVEAWREDPGGRLRFFLDNVRASCGYLWDGLWDGFARTHRQWVRLALAGTVVFALLVALFSPVREGMSGPLGGREGRRTAWAVAVIVLLLAMHVAAYSLVNARVRYMWQALPLLIVLLAVLMAGLARLARPLGAVVFVVGAVGLVAAQAPLAVTYRLPWTPPDRTEVPAPYQPIREWAEATGEVPRILYDDAVAPYYAEGYGIIVPYTEADPALLLHYMRKYAVEFSSIQQQSYLGSQPFDIPAYTMFTALAGQFPDLAGVVNEQVFRVGPLPPVGEAVDLDPAPGVVAPLEPGRYLLWMRATGPAPLDVVLEDNGTAVMGRLSLATAQDAMGGVSVYAAIAAEGLAAPALRFERGAEAIQDPGLQSTLERVELLPLPEPAP